MFFNEVKKYNFKINCLYNEVFLFNLTFLPVKRVNIITKCYISRLQIKKNLPNFNIFVNNK